MGNGSVEDGSSRLRVRSHDAGCAVFISGVKRRDSGVNRRDSGVKSRGKSPRVVRAAVHS
jgi:hypothetical protein